MIEQFYKHEYLTQPVKKPEDSYERLVAEMFQEETNCSDEYIKNLKWGQILGETELVVTRKSGFKKRIKLSRELITAITALDNGAGLVFPSLGGRFVPYPHHFMYHQRFSPYKNEKAQVKAFKQYQEWCEYTGVKQRRKQESEPYIGDDRIGYVGTRNSNSKLETFPQYNQKGIDISKRLRYN